MPELRLDELVTRRQMHDAIQEAIVAYHEQLMERQVRPLCDAIEVHTKQFETLRKRPTDAAG